MTDEITYCARGCVRWGRHLPHCTQSDYHTPGCVDQDCDGCNPDRCGGCEPRFAQAGLLCDRCLARLEQLLADVNEPESVAAVCTWLADNLGQHIRTGAGERTRSATPGEQFVTVMAALSDLQISWYEMAAEFLADRGMKALTDTEPAIVSGRLRPWLTSLAAWEPILDSIDHLIELRSAAHAVCPWRGKVTAGEDEAAMLYLAPAEETGQICQRFGITEAWLWQAKKRGKVAPVDPHARPMLWRPWDIFAVLHPDAARRYEAALARLAS